MAVEIDHLFVYTAPGAPEAALLGQHGLTESWRIADNGQGIGNVSFAFDNCYLELIWHADPAQVAASPLVRAAAPQRADWRRSGACPFGIGLRSRSGAGLLPFPAWDYQAPFFPPGTAMPIAEASADPCQPVLFLSPYGTRPDSWPPGTAVTRQGAAGLAEISGLRLELPPRCRPSEALETLAGAGLLAIGEGPSHALVLTLDRTGGQDAVTLQLPKFEWG